MDKRQAEFLARLRETFRIEAAERLAGMAAGLVALERGDVAERDDLIERVFREVHSLKGAARAVSLEDVGELCQEAESVFAALKADRLTPSTALFDVLHPTVDLLVTRCEKPDAAETPEEMARHRAAMADLRAVLRGEAPSARGRAAALHDAGPAAEATPPITEDVAKGGHSAGFVGSEVAPGAEGTASLGRHHGDTAKRMSAEDLSSPAPAVVRASVRAFADHPRSSEREASPWAQRNPVASDPAEPRPARAAPAAAAETVRVATQKLSALLLGAEELIGARIAAGRHAEELRALDRELGDFQRQRAQRVASLRARRRSNAEVDELIEWETLATRAIERSLAALARSVQQDWRAMATTVDALVEDARQALMLPCSHLTAVLSKLVRDMTRQEGKEADLVVRGDDVETDRRVLEELKDALIHLLRNAVDHGLEKPEERLARGKSRRGTVTLILEQLPGNKLEITVTDDGAGIDPVRVRASAVALGLLTAEQAAEVGDDAAFTTIFWSGLTTSPIVTDLSGRGLGLAIVREKVERLGGTIAVTSERGVGATFRMLVPMSLATFRGVLVRACGQRFLVSTAHVERALRVRPEDIRSVENRATVQIGDRAVALVRLQDVLGLSGRTEGDGGRTRAAILVRAADRQVAFLVDEVLGEQEVRAKSLGAQLARVRNVAGVTIAGDGTVIPILAPGDLLESAVTDAGAAAAATTDASARARRRVLVVEDSITSRALL